MVHFEVIIDPTSFRTVRQYLASPQSPITEILFVATQNLLPEVASLLDAESMVLPGIRRTRWHSLLNTGKVVPNLAPHCYGVDLDSVPDDTLCYVIFLPPVYLVHVPGLELRSSMRRAS